METVVDISGLLGPVVEFVFMAIGAGVLWLGRKALGEMEAKTNIQLDEQMKHRVDDALLKAVNFGKSRASDFVKRGVKIDVRNEIIANAVNYAQAAIPGTLEYFGITRDRLIDMIEARVGFDIDGDGDVAGTPA